MTITRKTGLAVVGLGMALTPHARSLADLSDRIEVVGAYSPSEQRCRRVARDTGYTTTTDLDRLLKDDAIDAALILTPPASHLEITERFFQAGKDVLLEKPLEISLQRAEALVESARRHNRNLGVVFQHRFRLGPRTLQDLIEGGTLGPLQMATCHMPWWRPQTYYDEPGRGTLARDGGGVLMTQAIHTLDVFRVLTGGIASVSAVAATTDVHTMETEDVVAAALKMRNGAPGNLVATTANYPGFSEEITLVFRNATARLIAGRLEVHYHDGRTDEMAESAEAGSGADPMAFAHTAHRALIEAFLEAGKDGHAPAVNGLEALRTQDIIEALLTSAGNGSWVDVRAR